MQGREIISCYSLISNPLYSPTIDVTIGKLTAVEFVTSAYQETAGLKLLAEENWIF